MPARGAAAEEAVLLRLTATLVERGWSAAEALEAVLERARPGALRERLLSLQGALAAGEDTAGAPDLVVATLGRAETVGAGLLRDLAASAGASAVAERQRRTGLSLSLVLLGLVCLILFFVGTLGPSLEAMGQPQQSGYGSPVSNGTTVGLAAAALALFVGGFFLLRWIWTQRLVREQSVAAWLHRHGAALAAGHPAQRAARLASGSLVAGSPKEACARLGRHGPELFEHLRSRRGEPEACRHLAEQLEIIGQERAARFLNLAPLWSALVVFGVVLLLLAFTLAISFGWMRLWL